MNQAAPNAPANHTSLTRRTLVTGLSAALLLVPRSSVAMQDRLGWQSTTPLPSPGSEFAAAVLDRIIYVAGRFDSESRLSAFDTMTGTWAERAALPEPRHHAGLAALGGHVYLAGGHDHDSHAVDTFWRYDPARDAWEDLSPLPQGPRGALGLAALDGMLYAVGGSSGDLSGPATADVARFDPIAMEWTALEAMPTAREHLSVAATAGMVVAIGGRNGGDISPHMAGATESFDPASMTWQAGSPLPIPRSGMGVAVMGETVIVIGGEGNDGLYEDVNRYDPVADMWDALPSLPTGRHGVAAAHIDGSLYAIGGSTLAFAIESVADVNVLDLVSS